MSEDERIDRQIIRELIETWVVARDSGDWDRFLGVWHEGGEMNATWFQGSAEAFLRASKSAWENGARVWHMLGGSVVDISGPRATAQTKMTISARAPVHGVACDVVSTGRFYDFLEKRRGEWGFVVRKAIYEKDRLDPVDPAAGVTLDPEILGKYPEGYRHLAYLQEISGMTVRSGLPGLRGPEVEALYAEGMRWLSGQPI